MKLKISLHKLLFFHEIMQTKERANLQFCYFIFYCFWQKKIHFHSSTNKE